MLEKPDAFHTVGIEFSSQSVKAAKLSMRKGQPFLDCCEEISYDPLSLDEPETTGKISDFQSSHLHNILKKSLIVTFLNTSEVLVRQLEVKLKKDSLIDEVLAFQAEPLLPYPVENALVDRIRLADTPEGSLLALFAVRKDHLSQHLDLSHRVGIEPEVISAAPMALATFARFFSSKEKTYYVVHLAELQTTCILMREGKLVAAQTCFQGISSLVHSYEKEGGRLGPSFADVDINAITQKQDPLLWETLELFRLEIKRTLYSLAKSLKGQEIDYILFTGEGASQPHLLDFLSLSLDKPIITPTSHPHFDISLPQLQKWALPIGTAMTALPNKKEQINFRQQEFAYPLPWKRYKKPVLLYLSLCVALAIAFYMMGISYVYYQKDQLRQEYADLLSFMNKRYGDFEREFESKFPNNFDGLLPIESLTMPEIEQRLGYLEKELRTAPNSYPLLPQVPTVSDVLAWLATHPNVVTQDPETKAPLALLKIENFHYMLIKKPDDTKKQEKYQVKVEIEFNSQTPKQAREFHDALIAPNAFVDPKGEVKWNTNRGLYRASFILKDKTVYPSP
jgi:type IV pilus assembly protein PilM